MCITFVSLKNGTMDVQTMWSFEQKLYFADIKGQITQKNTVASNLVQIIGILLFYNRC